jgi:hypothetical protein
LGDPPHNSKVREFGVIIGERQAGEPDGRAHRILFGRRSGA